MEYSQIIAKREIDSLQEQLHRALSELKLYQERYPSLYSDQTDEHGNFPPWVTSAEVMTPLLRAYDAKIKELESIATDQALQLDKLKNKVITIVQENEEIRQELLQYTSTSSTQNSYRSQQKDASNIAANTPIHDEYIKEMNERIDILLTENNLLLEQKSLLQEELESYQKELDQRIYSLDDITTKYIELETIVPILKNNINQLEKDREVVGMKAISYSEQYGKLQLQYNKLQEDYKQLHNKYIEVDKAYHEESNKYENYKLDMEKESYDCMLLAQKAEDRSADLKQKLVIKSQEFENCQEIVRNLRQEYSSTRQDAEGMIQVMSGLERQLLQYKEKEDEIERNINDWKSKVEDALCTRDQVVAREEIYKKEINRLHEDRLKLTLIREQEIEEALEKERVKLNTYITQLNNDLNKLVTAMGQHQATADKANREAKQAKQYSDKTQLTYQQELTHYQDQCKTYDTIIKKVTVEKESYENKSQIAQVANIQYRNTIDDLRQQLEQRQQEMNQKDRLRDRELDGLKTSYKHLQRETEEKTRLLIRSEKDMIELKNRFKLEYSALERRLGDENKELRKRIAEADVSIQQVEQQLHIQDIRKDHIVEQVRTSSTSLLSQLETELLQEKDNVKSLILSKRELETQMDMIKQENKDLSLVVSQADKAIDDLEKEIRYQQKMVSDLTQQLSHSYETRKKGAIIAAKRIALVNSAITNMTPGPKKDSLPRTTTSTNATTTFTNMNNSIITAAAVAEEDSVVDISTDDILRQSVELDEKLDYIQNEYYYENTMKLMDTLDHPLTSSMDNDDVDIDRDKRKVNKTDTNNKNNNKNDYDRKENRTDNNSNNINNQIKNNSRYPVDTGNYSDYEEVDEDNNEDNNDVMELYENDDDDDNDMSSNNINCKKKGSIEEDNVELSDTLGYGILEELVDDNNEDYVEDYED